MPAQEGCYGWILKVEAATTGKKTGPQTRKRKVGSNEHIFDKFEEKTIDGGEFIELPCGALIRKEWKISTYGSVHGKYLNHG